MADRALLHALREIVQIRGARRDDAGMRAREAAQARDEAQERLGKAEEQVGRAAERWRESLGLDLGPDWSGALATEVIASQQAAEQASAQHDRAELLVERRRGNWLVRQAELKIGEAVARDAGDRHRRDRIEREAHDNEEAATRRWFRR